MNKVCISKIATCLGCFSSVWGVFLAKKMYICRKK